MFFYISNPNSCPKKNQFSSNRRFNKSKNVKFKRIFLEIFLASGSISRFESSRDNNLWEISRIFVVFVDFLRHSRAFRHPMDFDWRSRWEAWSFAVISNDGRAGCWNVQLDNTIEGYSRVFWQTWCCRWRFKIEFELRKIEQNSEILLRNKFSDLRRISLHWQLAVLFNRPFSHADLHSQWRCKNFHIFWHFTRRFHLLLHRRRFARSLHDIRLHFAAQRLRQRLSRVFKVEKCRQLRRRCCGAEKNDSKWRENFLECCHVANICGGAVRRFAAFQFYCWGKKKFNLDFLIINLIILLRMLELWLWIRSCMRFIFSFGRSFWATFTTRFSLRWTL